MKEKILEILKNTDSYISGEEMSKRLGISRAAIWKHINGLKKDGYIIDSQNNLGYKIIDSPDILNAYELKTLLNTSLIGKEIIHYDTIDSTNIQAKKIAIDSNTNGTILVAEEQTLGRGRLGRQWISPKYKGIWMSIILSPEILPSEAHKISIIAAAAVHTSLINLGVSSFIKWPNDILINNKKVCGILTEMSAELNKINYIIVGIGINVNTDEEDFPIELRNLATSIKLETKKTIDRKKLFTNIVNNFEKLYLDFILNKNIKKSIDIVREFSILKNQIVKINNLKETIEAKVLDIDDEGYLIVEHNNNIIRVFSGEVSLSSFYNR
ncbi:MAG: biotin--[acetyl-CoA-carboxylase] ligase [Clostridiales bacterium]|nr:biotin--[acetyl-CoA-carboxylase] ligase [Clostridiales bacterium]